MYRTSVIRRLRIPLLKYLVFEVCSQSFGGKSSETVDEWLSHRIVGSYLLFSNDSFRVMILLEYLIFGLTQNLYSLNLTSKDALSIVNLASKIQNRPIRLQISKFLDKSNLSKVLDSDQFGSPYFLESLSLSGIKLPLLPTIMKFPVEQLAKAVFIQPSLETLSKIISEFPRRPEIESLCRFLRKYHFDIDDKIRGLIQSLPGLYFRLRYPEWCCIYIQSNK